MRTLHLTLKKKWFDMILSGEKKEEYREIKPYWINRLPIALLDELSSQYLPYGSISKVDYHRVILERSQSYLVCFKNGYAKNAPSFLIELKSIHVGKPSKGLCEDEWLDTDFFVLTLGKIINND